MKTFRVFYLNHSAFKTGLHGLIRREYNNRGSLLSAKPEIAMEASQPLDQPKCPVPQVFSPLCIRGQMRDAQGARTELKPGDIVLVDLMEKSVTFRRGDQRLRVVDFSENQEREIFRTFNYNSRIVCELTLMAVKLLAAGTGFGFERLDWPGLAGYAYRIAR